MESPMITPASMAFFPKLEILNYTGPYSHGLELARVVEKGTLPHLREIHTSFLGPMAEDGILRERDEKKDVEISREMGTVCRERKIFCRDMFTVVEELEEHYGELERVPDSPDNDWTYRDEEPSSQVDRDVLDGWEL
ncbi:hypothetical protein SCHPADRAFT_927078 [Schizopora paradoxa]|uniref:Uncharacterized protein n=1 Tax=Schizopora paradoxa TaxID=27342 RepID=A0A0H2RUP8_9AGAM|nr:hypothetical protein SCHPADRAFT_927078 [Schizopora paradoxa]